MFFPGRGGKSRATGSRMRLALGLLALAAGGSGAARAADWLKLTAPGYTIVSDGSEARTRGWAVEFERFRQGIATLLPLDQRNLEPVTMVVFQHEREFRAFKARAEGKPARVGGYFLRAPGRNMIAVSLGGAGWDLRRRIFHEATHWYLSAAEHPLPLWLNEGLAEVFSTFTVSGGRFSVGSSRFEYQRILQAGGLMPFAQLAAIGEEDMNYSGKHAEQTERFYAQSWATAHLFLLGEGSVSRLRLQRYLRAPVVAGEPRQDFTTFIGRAPAAVDAAVNAYVRQTRIKVFTAPAAREVDKAAFRVEPATAGEVDLALGNLLLAVDRAPDARSYLERAATEAPDDPRPHEALGVMEWRSRRPEAAVEQFKASFARGGDSFAAHYLAAVAELNGVDVTSMGRFSTRDYAEIVEHLATAMHANPRFRPGYQLAGLLVAFAPIAVQSKLEPLLDEAVRRGFTGPGVELGLGFVAARKGDLTAAREHARRAEAMEHDPARPVAVATRRLERLIARGDGGLWRQ